ncbi:MAG TPA: toll/interleukin-1 receptor domain-containing protein [Sphingomicrobium sp.]|nr:toll/interleukin-1 receptor domain-containing protein [Sphingomicrobium sp.]
MSNARDAGAHFLSYSRADQDFALRFARDLRANGVAIWVDQLDIRPSEHWDRAIERAVRDCRGLVVIVSPRSAASDNVADEISFAIDHRKSVLPVMIERCTLPLRIARMQVIDATVDYTRALQQCVEVISSGAVSSTGDEGSASPLGIHDPQIIIAAKKDLTAILGPVAAIVVDKEARKARSLDDFYRRLSEHIPEGPHRERFTRSTQANVVQPAPAQPSGEIPASGAPLSIDAAELDRLGSILTHYLGPIATVIARREGAEAQSLDDLQQRLASKIPDERQRVELLERLRQR